ncbi:hypothetical protein [Nesterenkonia sp. CF4.4]|uniref:hypothetical protein n=1 Tax=Nesterenkonia sp. CF4.4 TaxID=3373079 RepID=UPI003EE4A836
MTDSTETITTAADETADLIRGHEAKVKEAQAFRDPDLTGEANARKRAELTEAAQAEAEQALLENRTKVESAAAAELERFEASRPKIQGTPEALIEAEHVWKYDVLPVLESGTPLKEFLRGASQPEVLAAERFARGHLRAKNGTGQNPLELTPDELGMAAANRLASVIPDGPNREAFERGVRTAHAAQVFAKVDHLAGRAIAGKHYSVQSAYAEAKTAAINLQKG